MGLASALSTALTGLAAAETTIDVVGNNLANSNTVGFKASKASFSTQFLQTLSLGSQPTTSSGGTNPRQIGLGTMVSDITPDFNQGTLEISSNPTDLAIQGEGFFMVQGGAGERVYTRNGIFKFNSQNEMVTITGNRLLGFGIDDQYQIQRTILEPVTIPLGSAAVAQPTANVDLEGTLSPTGDLADTAQRIQTGILGNDFYSAPTTDSDTDLAVAPIVTGVLWGSLLGGGMTAGSTYEYKFVWAEPYNPPLPAPPPPLTESHPSDVVTATVGALDGSINLTNIPTVPPFADYTNLRIYRRDAASVDPKFFYIDEIPVAAGSYLDILDDVTMLTRPELDEALIAGNYSYYITYADSIGGPGVGIESRPAPFSGPINVGSAGRVHLSDLPVPDPIADPRDAMWTVRRIYRNLFNDASTFHFVAEVPNIDPADTITDNLSDDTIKLRPTIDLDGPKIIYSTLLTDVLSRDGSTYDLVFEAGTLDFTGRKGGRALATKTLEVTAASTVQDLLEFIDEAMGIRATGDDPVNTIPSDTPSGESPGGIVSGGRMILTGNNGVDNAIDIGLSGMLLTTATATENVNMPWGMLQAAVGESAVADFIAYDSLGIPISVRLTAVMESRDSTSTTYRWFADSPDNDPVSGVEIAVGTGLITFDGEGNLISSSNSTVSVERRNVSSASPLEFQLDFNQLSGLAADQSSLAVSRQDGSGPGVLTSFIIGEDGTIRGVFSNGITRDLGQIRLARFANAAGLDQRGENLYAEGINSGLPVEGDPGNQGIGTIISGAVELSNTDIGSNLIDLILASTMYRGNTRVITTVQQMIDELLALRR